MHISIVRKTDYRKMAACTAQKPLPRIICLTLLIGLIFPSVVCRAARDGDLVNVVPFGQVKKWNSQGKDYGVIFEDARDIFRVVVSFADSKTIPDAQSIRLEYWQSSWPLRRIPREKSSGAGSSGWLNVGDWFQGKWVKADTNLDVKGTTCTFTFNPVNAKEFPKLKDFSARYRSTLKLRLVADKSLPEISAFEAYTDSVWAAFEFEVQWGGNAKNKRQNWDGRLEVFNGINEQVQPLSAASKVKVGHDYTWKSKVKEKTDGIRARILYAKVKGHNSFDETIITVRAKHETFSFAASDLIKQGHIFIPDFGVIVRGTGDDTTYKSAEQNWQNNKNKNIYTRVSGVPEQTLTQAWKDIPDKGHHYIPLSFEGGRQHFGVDADGSVFCHYHWLSRLPGRDTKRCLYEGNNIRYRFGLSGAKLVDRHIVDGCLPIIVSQWQRDGVQYRQTAFVVPFDGVPEAGQRIFADDTLVLMMRFEIQPVDNADCQAKLDLEVIAGGTEQLTLENGLIFAEGQEPKRLRMLFTSSDTSSSYSLTAQDKKVIYRAGLTADNPKRTIDIAIPYITLTESKEWEALRRIRFYGTIQAVREYWRKRVQAGAQILTPEPMINDFYKAHVSHLLINTEREVGTSDRYMAKVGTFHYGVYSNESCMMVSDLDRRGYHKRAEQALETWLHYQGTVGLPGDFSTKKGQFYGAAGYEAGGYNQHHGFVLWCLGEHYWYTRDVDWLKRAAPKIVKGCQWIIRERSRTIVEADRSPIRAIERGLLPPGSLEDISDWRSWLSTNIHSWWGMQNAAAALDAAGLPEGKRLLKEAAAYRKDILTAFTEAMQRSPVVRLRDGSWIPHVPPESHRRGRTFGWLTETLEGAIHMIRTGMIEPHDRLATWIIKDFEDNLYISEQYGYNITGAEFERYWFSRGGISMQANLLCNPIPYLLRDEPKHFLRAYFNAFAVSYFPDTRMMTEHALPNIGDWRGDHYKASDEANSTYWLRMMFILETGEDLWIGSAVPRYWLANGKRCGIVNAGTYFGPMSAQYESRVAEGRIEMTIDPPRRNPPKRILVRFRHPDGRRMTSCKVNGKAYKRIDPVKELIVLTKCRKPIRIIAYYD
ncbi:MAG: hypothetical protein FVQ85_11885 [Planctomycetes bacterium]|nr:hypothetical protein [Planctomycetota bacterium]